MKVGKVISTVIGVVVLVCVGYVASRNLIRGESVHDHDAVISAEEHVGDSDAGHEEHAIELTVEEIAQIGLETATAGSGVIEHNVRLAGEISANQDRMAHVVPRVDGVVKEVFKSLGDGVMGGEIMAVIESQTLADTKAAYLASIERLDMAKLAFSREEKLWQDKISSEQDYLDKKQAMIEAGITRRAAEQKLHAIGFYEEYLKVISNEPEAQLTRLEIKAPFDGTVIEKHIVLGELVGTDATVYVVADLSTVWVNLQVYPRDLIKISKGQQAVISADSEIPEVAGSISYVGPVVGTESRTALARVVVPNESGVFRPGLFVTASVSVSKTTSAVAVPTDCVQTIEGKKCVFVKDEHGFEPVFVEIGTADENLEEILSGLEAGQEYVCKGAFALKAKIVTSTLGGHAGHGH